MKSINNKELLEAARPLIKLLCEQGHPYITAIVTPTGVEMLEGINTVQNVHDYIAED